MYVRLYITIYIYIYIHTYIYIYIFSSVKRFLSLGFQRKLTLKNDSCFCLAI